MDARHFIFKRDKKSLDLKNTRLWKIVWNINTKAYKLDIPETLKAAGLTSIFHLWKLYLALNNPFSRQISSPSPPIEISAKNNKAYEEWKLLKVVDCLKTKR